MALIICDNCGKKYSDSVEKCIHCGFLKEEVILEVPKPEEKVEEKTEQKAEPIKDYFLYNKKEKTALERVFINSDEWAYKYKRKDVLHEKTRIFCGIVLFLSLIYLPLAKIIYELFMKDKEMNLEAILLGLVVIACTGAISIIILIINGIMERAHKRSLKRVIYYKKFQKWLYDTRKITFEPIFGSKVQQAQFDNFDLD